MNGGRPFYRGETPFHFPEGETHVPPAGWEQHPGEFAAQHRPVIRWGDVVTFNIPPDPLGGNVTTQQAQFLEFHLLMPAACMLRLSAVDRKQSVIAPADIVTWTLLIGVGNATATKRYQTAINPLDGSADHDLLLEMPIEHLAVSATTTLKALPADSRTIEIVAQCAPITAYAGLVHP